MSHSPLASPTATRAALERYGLATKHHLGQNFLVNDSIVGKILDLAELSPADAVLEVGPGLGTLTCAMLPPAGSVTALEADRELEPALRDLRDQDARQRLTYVMGDALRLIPDAVADARPTKLVSNLPYQVAATLILQVFETLPSVGREVVMVQREVADRICAAPGTKAYGAYTAKLAQFAEVTGRFEVGPGNFMPPPHVDSSVVRLDRRARAMGDDASWTCAVIDAAFAQRRKTIRNSMAAGGFGKDALDAAFAEAGVAPTARAETLAPEDFVRLAQVLAVPPLR